MDMASETERMQACAGLRVVDLAPGMAGAMAGMILADHGAEVVKIEPPSGASERALPGHRMWNRGKRSVVLDLDVAADRAELDALAASADVVLTTLRPARFDVSAVRTANPGVVACVLNGLGPLDPDGRVPAYDATVSALVGRMFEVDTLSGAVRGQDRTAPIFTAAPVLAYGAAQLAVQGVLAALLRRERTGEGATVRTSLLESWTVFMMRHPLVRDGDVASDLPPAMQRGLELCFMTAECADGTYLQMCARQDKHFRSWLAALDLGYLLADPRFADPPLGLRTVADADELERMLRARMLTRTRAEWLELFSTTFDVGGDPFLTSAEFLDHPQLVANDRVVTLDDPEVGPVRQIGLLAELRDTPGEARAAAPLLGADGSAAIRASWSRRPTSAARAVHSGRSGLPLAGLTVLEAAHFVAGPLAGSLLAELGARVIKLEPLAGDPFRRTGSQSVKFLLGKESLALDLKHPAALRILDALVARSDVFVHGFRPGVPERLSMGYERLSGLNPRLLYVCASAYGSRGPQRDRAAFHSTPTALSGAGIVQAGLGNPPVDDSFPDPAGALAVATAVLLGLHARTRTGRGQYVETMMLTSAGYVMSGETVSFRDRAPVDVPDSGQHGPHARYRLYECSQGWLFLAAVRNRDLAPLIGLVPEAAGGLGDEQLTGVLTRAFRARPAADWVAALTACGVPAVVVTPTGSEHWLQEQNLLVPDEHPAFGSFWRLPTRIRFGDARGSVGPAAALGEHSHSLLAELGHSDAEIAGLVKSGVIGVYEQVADTAAGHESTVRM